MSREHVEIARGVYARWANGNMRAGVDLFGPATAFDISFTPDSNRASSPTASKE